ncbi:unnamed protein product [Lymnaea stagnalis]|uniref:ShKT domain-containing protein n=1 Tax=Lymnaea stagnalis TaxID=6523 RepID=A0AAV2HJF2_LYMST
MSGQLADVWPGCIQRPRSSRSVTLCLVLPLLAVQLVLLISVHLDIAEAHKKGSCTNTHRDDALCDRLARQGQCDTKEWMLDNCERSCELCSRDKDDNARFRRILDEFYDYKSQEFPEYATYVGKHDYDDVLESFKMDAFDRRKNETERFLHRLKNLDPNKLSRINKRERRIVMSCLHAFVDGYKWREYGALNSINFLEGLANGPQWPIYSRLESEKDFERYLKRLAAVPDQINDQITLMKRAIKLKRSSHLVSVSRVPSMLKDLDVDMFFLVPFQHALTRQGFSPHTKLQMWDKARSLMPYVSQALNRLKQFMDKDYFDATREQPGVHSLPQGKQYYEACLKWYLGYDAKAEDVFSLGVSEVNRIEKLIKEVMMSVGFNGDLKTFFKHIETIPKFYNHSKEQILQNYRTMLDNQIIPKLATLFYNVSIAPITVISVERDGPWGSYGSGRFYVNLKEPEKRSTFTMMPLTLHEAYPGHHFQDLYSQHFDIPMYRAQPMNGRLYSVPFHFPVYSAYSEGWALYSEYLGHELGLYQDPYELFGRYVSEIFRACRLVVDTGIHAFGWSREQAIDFLNGYSDFPLSQIAAEVDRYITAPGQACAYKVGEIKIKNMRQKAEKALASMFDVKEFHHQILKIGYVPLDILEEVIEEWVQSKLKNDPSVTADYDDITTGESLASKHVTSNSLLLLLCITHWFVNYITFR